MQLLVGRESLPPTLLPFAPISRLARSIKRAVGHSVQWNTDSVQWHHKATFQYSNNRTNMSRAMRQLDFFESLRNHVL